MVLLFAAAILAGLMLKDAEAADNCPPDERLSSSSFVDAVKLSRFSPRARADFVAAIVGEWPTANAADISTQLRIQHFMTQIATETGGVLRHRRKFKLFGRPAP